MTFLSCVGLVCTLKAGDGPSSSHLLAQQVLDELAEHGVTGEPVRVANEHVAFGVTQDEGDGDGWPTIRDRVMAADIVLISTPIWMGQPASMCKVVLERLDAELNEIDEQGRMSTYPKVAVIAVVGNEDGATYWVGEAMGKTDYQDLEKTPETTAGTTRTLAANAAHLARSLHSSPYPGAG